MWVGGAYEGLSVTAMMTKECEQVLGKKAQGVGAPSALSIFKGKVSVSVVYVGKMVCFWEASALVMGLGISPC